MNVYLPDFEYFAPADVREACALLARFGPQARILAGGTDLLPRMKNGLVAPEVLVSLKNLTPLTRIYHARGRGVVIGALVTLNGLVNSPLLKERYPSICEAARSMANHQIRCRGTVGGNIANALPSADLPPILIALEALVRLTSREG
ncbi:MAG: FAD binding domain-containing protein, partial [Desulfotomaculales bacterium]